MQGVVPTRLIVSQRRLPTSSVGLVSTGSQEDEIMAETRSRATALLDAEDVAGACLEWDAYIRHLSLDREQPTAYLAYEALMERLALPAYVPPQVIAAAHTCLVAGREVLTEAVQADFEMILTTARFDTGGATFAEALRSTRWATETTGRTDGVGLPPLRAVAQLGHLAAAYVDIGAHEQAGAQVGKALELLGLSPLAAVDQATLSESVRRLVSGLDMPLIQLGLVRNSAPGAADSAAWVESVSWIRQLESEIAVLRGDWATAIAVCQALSVIYRGRGDAIAVNAAQIMVDQQSAELVSGQLLQHVAATASRHLVTLTPNPHLISRR